MEQPIATLNLPKELVDKFHKAGFRYCSDVNRAFVGSNCLVPIGQKEWHQLTSAPECKTTLDLLEEECCLGYTPTCIGNFDDLLGGGIAPGIITEFTGEPGSGKTQLCFYLCVNVQIPKWCGGIEGEALYISTNGKFAKHRLREIALESIFKYEKLKEKSFLELPVNDNFIIDDILRKVHYIEAENHEELLFIIDYLKEWLSGHKLVRLIIINSITAALRPVDGEKRVEVVYKLLTNLQVLAQKYNLSIVVTNDMTTKRDANGSSHRPSLGDSYFHRINTRICLSKIRANWFRAKIVKSVTHNCSETVFRL